MVCARCEIARSQPDKKRGNVSYRPNDMESNNQASALNPPTNQSLPFFSYGLLKPDELAFEQIDAFLIAPPQPFKITGSLWIRDGLPLLELQGSDDVKGYLLHINDHGYESICRFEPSKHYRWKEHAVSGIRMNVLLGRSPNKGSVRFESTEYSSSSDPVFKFALQAIRKVIDADGLVPFNSSPPEHLDWEKFFRLEMAYLLLWSVIERYCSFRFGPRLKPTDKIKHLGEDTRFSAAFGKNVTRSDQVLSAEQPDDKYRLDPSNPVTSVKYYYQIRSNLSHRGKGAWHEANKLQSSLTELTGVIDNLLEGHWNR